jgi:hypothetical protein
MEKTNNLYIGKINYYKKCEEKALKVFPLGKLGAKILIDFSELLLIIIFLLNSFFFIVFDLFAHTWVSA